MFTNQSFDLACSHRNDLLAEIERDRLASLVPAGPSAFTRARRGLATLCVRLAAWLDEPPGYVQMPEAGPEDWVVLWRSA